MENLDDVEEKVIFSFNQNLAILHCRHPAKVEEMDLSVLNTYAEEFQKLN